MVGVVVRPRPPGRHRRAALSSVDIAPFRDAYLAPFADRFPGDLVAATRTALRLGWACRAINGHVSGDEDRTVARLRAG